MSNKKLTTEEKEKKSKDYNDELARLSERIRTITKAKKKIDREIEDEHEKAELATDQTVGRSFRKRIKVKLPMEHYESIMDLMFMHEDCIAFIAEEIEKYNQEVEKSKNEKEAAAGDMPAPAERKTVSFEGTGDDAAVSSESRYTA